VVGQETCASDGRRDTLSELEDLIETLRDLSPPQLEVVRAVANAVAAPYDVYVNDDSDLFDLDLAYRFGIRLVSHHAMSNEAFTKDKFEHALTGLLLERGRKVSMAPRGNPGHDLTVDDERWSLKTQADLSIKRSAIHISKFMELGKGRWETEGDLAGLRDQMLAHMTRYDRIFSLRCLSSSRAAKDRPSAEYEFVEIPKAILARAIDGEIAMDDNSRQRPKPGHCYVRDDRGSLMLELYFDGGSERKLQIRKLDKSLCMVHATWQFTKAGAL